MRRTYQNVVINGKDNGNRPSRKDSKFYNEGKWNTFIEPLLPKDCTDMTFIEFGCNAGMYLKMAKDRGFRRVVGIEMEEKNFNAAQEYLGEGYELIHSKVNREFNTTVLDTLPAADVVLMANFHYHVHTPVILNMVNTLRRKCMYLIVVGSSEVRTNYHRIRSTEEATRRLFRHWEEVKHIPQQSVEDLHPRDMFSMLFKTEILKWPIKKAAQMPRNMRVHYAQILAGECEPGRHEFTIPVIVKADGSFVDGLHRLATYVQDGYKDVLVEVE